MATEVINNNGFRPSSNSVEVKAREVETIDPDLRDFIKGDISMDELFKRKEMKDEN